jgi:predicted AlkP superfamily phosphohydrolase/phosphomutase
MPTRVLFVGLDAAEATLIERWAQAGELPTFARLAAARAPLRLHNPLETLPGAIWPELTTGRSGGKDGVFYHPRQIPAGEARFRPLRPEDVDARTFFAVASEAGRRVAVVDLPQTVPAPGGGYLHVREWGLHDRNFAIASDPPELIAELRARHGDHPIVACDTHGETEQGYESLLRGLLDGVRAKTALLLELLARDEWDLFACAFGETHCVGHHFWHFFDAASARHTAAPARFRDAIRSVYRAVDDGLARILAAAGPRTEALVVASHGMGPYLGGPHLLPEVLARLGMGGPLRTRLRANLPQPVVAALRRVLPLGLRRRAHGAAERLAHPFESAATRAVCVENNRCGAIRLNLRGRDPHGSVAPGPQADALIDELRAELLALAAPTSGERIVARVVTASEAFGTSVHPNVPDLMVVFRTDLGPLEACQSPRVGVVRAGLHKPHLPRTGDHTIESRLWVTGPTLPAAIATNGHVPDVLDVAPTLLALLDVPRPPWLDGRSLVQG